METAASLVVHRGRFSESVAGGLVVRARDRDSTRYEIRILKRSIDGCHKGLWERLGSAIEHEGVLATRLMGRIRLVTLNPGYYAFKELRRLLLRLAEAEPTLRRAAGDQRQRTVRGGKSIT